MNRLNTYLFKQMPRQLARPHFIVTPKRGWEAPTTLAKRVEQKYQLDPKDTADRISRILALHDKCIDPQKITLNSTFAELGFNELDVAEITLMVEHTFDIYINEEDAEKLVTVNDLNERVATDWWAQ